MSRATRKMLSVRAAKHRSVARGGLDCGESSVAAVVMEAFDGREASPPCTFVEFVEFVLKLVVVGESEVEILDAASEFWCECDV